MAGRQPEVPDAKILHLIAISPAPIVTSVELADRVDMTQQGMHKRLKQFQERDWVASKKVGANARVWWLTDEGRAELARHEWD